MNCFKSRLLLLVVLVLFLPSLGSAAVTSLDIVNVFPTDDIRETGTVVVTRLEADSTTSTTVNLWLTKPDGTAVKIGEQDLSVKSGNPRENAFSVPGSVVDQYGTYVITANETANGFNQTLNTVVSPVTEVSISVPNMVYPNEDVEDVQIAVRTQSGDVIPNDEVVPGKVEVYEINDDPDTSEVEKELAQSVDLVYDNVTNNLEGSIPVSDLETGDYEVVGNFNISSCGQCEGFESVSTDTFLVRTGWDRLTYQDKWSGLDAGVVNDNVVSINDRVSEIDGDLKNVRSSIQGSISELSKYTPSSFGLSHSTLNSVLLMILVLLVTLMFMFKD